MKSLDTDNRENTIINSTQSSIEIPKNSLVLNELYVRRNVRNCIYALRHKTRKEIEIVAAKSFNHSLGRIIDNLETKEWMSIYRNRNSILVEILEDNIEDEALFIRQSYYIETYLSKGYKLYRNRPTPKFKLRKVYHITEIEDKHSISLYIESNNRNRTLVGNFYNESELQKFVSTHYPDGKVTHLVRQNDETT